MAKIPFKAQWLAMWTVTVLVLGYFPHLSAQDLGSAGETQEPVQRPCRDEDLAGHMFKMVYFTEKPERAEAMWVNLFPYQYTEFGPKQTYATMAFNREYKDAKRIKKSVEATYKAGNFYSLDKNGTLTLVQNEKIKYIFSCVAVLKKYDVYIPGDLILTGYTKRRKSELFKLYRRWY